jgi:hypothetical protein
MYEHEEQRIERLEAALGLAIDYLVALMGSDADDSETVAYLNRIYTGGSA